MLVHPAEPVDRGTGRAALVPHDVLRQAPPCEVGPVVQEHPHRPERPHAVGVPGDEMGPRGGGGVPGQVRLAIGRVGHHQVERRAHSPIGNHPITRLNNVPEHHI
jgi:hypothetical protein